MQTQKIKITVEVEINHDRNFVSAHAAMQLPAASAELDVFRVAQTDDVKNCLRAVLYRLAAMTVTKIAQGNEPPQCELRRMFNELPELEIPNDG